METPEHINENAGEVIRLLMELRSQGIRNHEVMSAIESVPRERFIPKIFAERAYEDVSLPISAGQTITAPSLIATMLEALAVDERSIVLDIGTGSGYMAAILGKLARRVYTIEHHRELHIEAEERFNALGYTNITAVKGDGCNGWPEPAPYDRIIASGSMNAVSSHLLEQLADGGILILPVGSPTGAQKLLKITKDKWNYNTSLLQENTHFDPLIEESNSAA